MSLFVTDEVPRPTRVTRPCGTYAYTVMTIPEVNHLPYYYLSGLSQAARVGNPVGFYSVFPQDFRPVSII